MTSAPTPQPPAAHNSSSTSSSSSTATNALLFAPICLSLLHYIYSFISSSSSASGSSTTTTTDSGRATTTRHSMDSLPGGITTRDADEETIISTEQHDPSKQSDYTQKNLVGSQSGAASSSQNNGANNGNHNDPDSFNLHSPNSAKRDQLRYRINFDETASYERRKVASGDAAALITAVNTRATTSRKIDYTHRFSILTFNDVYEINPSYNGSGGLANMHTLIRQQIDSLDKVEVPYICTLNGDFLSASLLAPKFHGKHMTDILNTMPLTHVSLGNHEFDFKKGDQPSDVVLLKRMAESNFKWMNSNVFSRGELFPNTLSKEVISLENENGEVVKVGLFSLCTGATRVLSYPPDYVQFQNPVTAAKRMVAELRDNDGCDIVIALTHLTMSQDITLATSVPGINVIVGGHDHQPITQQQGSTTIIKCGQNAKYLGRIDLFISKQHVTLKDEDITTVDSLTEWDFLGNFGYEPHPETHKIVQEYSKHLPSDWDEFLGVCGSPLDSTTSLCRSTETTMCSLLADALLEHYKSDAVIINAGTCRGDRLYMMGAKLLKSDMYSEFPFESYPRYGVLTGAQLIGAIEDGLKNIGSGGFPHLSKGFKVTYDPAGEIGSRIVEISLHGEEIDRNKEYTVVSTDWLFLHGGDNYRHLVQGKVIPHEEDKYYLREHAMRWIKNQKVVKIYLEGRMQKL